MFRVLLALGLYMSANVGLALRFDRPIGTSYVMLSVLRWSPSLSQESFPGT